jgi:hypothetical protein
MLDGVESSYDPVAASDRSTLAVKARLVSLEETRLARSRNVRAETSQVNGQNEAR